MSLSKVEEDRLYNRAYSPAIATNGYANSSDSESSFKPGAKPLETYLEPDDYEAYGFTQEKILENYRFYGTLMKRVKGNFRLKERIAKSNAKNIEEIDDIYGSGHYQLRVETADGGEDRIDFQIPDTTPDESKQPNTHNDTYYHSLRRELMQEAREEMKAVIEQLETRIRLKDNELDEKSAKIRSLSEEIGQLQRNAWGQAQGEIDRLRDRIDGLKTEVQNKEMEILKLEMDLQYSDIDADQDWLDRVQTLFEKALEHPAFAQMISKKSPAMLGGAASTSQNGGQKNSEADNKQTEPETQNSSQPSIMHQIANVLFQNAKQHLQAEQPDKAAITELIAGIQQEAQKQGIGKIPVQSWITASRAIVDYALEHNTPAGKVAEVIHPIVSQLNGAESMLSGMPTKAAVNMLITSLNLEVSDAQKEFISDVITIFKKQIN